ncbi:hypothetical protein C900_05030 [Fulvivirga imtechensis AK7]|uniref:DUF998 domain-containing protein n=2 Tax=Fulvivirga TaxID=396811 RepID=L8JMN0_9BACT|nr:hypothetical protein C900_05030 [Fulvivirga imtechensis AK7]
MVYCLMLGVIFILPFFSTENYSIWRNTTSHLGAQYAPNAGIMNATFVMLGASSMLAGWNFFRGYGFHQVVLVVFGASLTMTGFFRHAPIDQNEVYNIREDELHSIFASLTGFAFTTLAISIAFIVHAKDRVAAIVIAIVAPSLSLLIFYVEDLMGIWQRMIFVISFAWLIYLFNKNKIQNPL